MCDQETNVKSYAQMLQDGLDEVFSSEPFRRFLAFIAQNPNYSYRNVLIILQLCPHATRTMGFRTWLRQGRCVRQGERGIRINAPLYNADKEDDQPQITALKQGRKKKDKKFRKISVFDISQTVPLDDTEDSGDAAEQAPRPTFGAFANPFETEMLEGEVAHYDRLLEILRQISPLPIQFKSGLSRDGMYGPSAIAIRSGMSQLHTIRTIVNQIAHGWRRGFCPDGEQLEIEAESIAFIVCRYFGLDTSDFSFNHIAKCSFGRERKSLEQFLDAIQKAALHLIDSIDGIQETQRIGYDSTDYFLFVNPKTALRLYWRKLPVYLVFPGEGELLTMNRKAIEEHPGPFATDRVLWCGAEQMAA